MSVDGASANAETSPLQGLISKGTAAAQKLPQVASEGLKAGKTIAGTKIGSRALTGAAAGAAIAAALPFVSIISGALLGAGALVMWKTAKDEE